MAKVGRPSKYDPKYSQECPAETLALPADRRPQCLHLVCHMAQGKSLESYAWKIGTHRKTLYDWEEEREEFSDAIKRGRDASLAWWEDLVRTGTAGQLKTISTEEVNAKGQVVKRKFRSAHFAPVGAIFTMKNRFPTLYRDKIVLATEPTGGDDLSGKTIDELYAESERLHGEIQKARKK